MGCIVIQPTSTLEQNIMTVKIIECYKLTMTRSKNESNRVSYLPDEGRGHCLLYEPCKHRLTLVAIGMLLHWTLKTATLADFSARTQMMSSPLNEGIILVTNLTTIAIKSSCSKDEGFGIPKN